MPLRFQGRRTYKKVTTNGTVTLHQRYIYRGYLQISACDLTRSNHPALWFITWDPTQLVATLSLAIRKDGTWIAYGWDLTKNICEVFGTAGYIRTAYTYTPFGKVSATGDITQPIQCSSEVWDSEMGLVYYNWRYYNALDGRWINRDNQREGIENNLYFFVKNSIFYFIDNLGLADVYMFSYKVTEKTEHNGANLWHSMIDEIAKNASEYTGKHIYEIAQSASLLTNTARPVQGVQFRYFIRFYCECDDGCLILNIGSTKPKIKTRSFVLTAGALGLSTQNGSAGFSIHIPVPLMKAHEFVNKNIDNYIEKAKIKCLEECKKIK